MTIGSESSTDRKLLFGHPRGLFVIASTEVWDRISFHGMQALLTLYLAHQLLLPGHIEHIVGFHAFRGGVEWITGPLSIRALATQVFGLYVGLVYMTPAIGGFVGDRLVGRRPAIVLGGLLMTAGHFSMAFDASFLLALLLLILGAGLFRGNLQPQVGELYALGDRRRAVAYQIYGAAVNFGALIAPLATGALGKYYGWHIGFAFAGFGMLVGLIIYLVGGRGLPARRPVASDGAPAQKLRADEWRTILFLLGLVPVASLFWVAQSQIWNTYNLWVGDHIELHIMGWEMPIPWLQSLDGFAPFITLPPVLWLWHWQASRHREPDEFVKAATGCFIFALSTWWLGFAGLAADSHGRAPLLWAVVFHFASNLGWIYFAPTMTALFSRLAPASVNATMIGIYSLSVSLGSFVSGRLGGLYERVSPGTFWTIHAALVALGGVLMLAFGFGAKFAARPAAAARVIVDGG
jgi:POT family proton-dependent oligopeptide transporter